MGSDEEFTLFLLDRKHRNSNDFNIELFLRAKFLPKFLSECSQANIKDLYVIFDNAAQTHSAAKATRLCLRSQPQICASLRKLEFSHSPHAHGSEFEVVKMMLC